MIVCLFKYPDIYPTEIIIEGLFETNIYLHEAVGLVPWDIISLSKHTTCANEAVA